MTLWLSDDELVDATHRKQPARQAKVLDAMGIPYQRRPDGTLLVGRAAIEAALGGGSMRVQPASNGLPWSRHA